MNFNAIDGGALREWIHKNKLKKPVYRRLLDAYRRAHQFHDGNYRYEHLILALPSEARQAIKEGYLMPYDKEIPRVSNWYSLTDKGVLLVETLEPVIGEWNGDKNLVIFAIL